VPEEPKPKKKVGRPKKALKTYLGKNQLQKLLDNPKLTIEDMAIKLRASEETVRKYIHKHGL
jgi:predicted transcriptional regulator